MQILSISICIASLCLQREHCSEKSVLSLFTTLKEESINKRPSNNWEAKRQRRILQQHHQQQHHQWKNSAPHTQYIYNQYGRQNWQYFKVSTQSLWVRYCYVRVHVLCMRYFSLSTFIFSLFRIFIVQGIAESVWLSLWVTILLSLLLLWLLLLCSLLLCINEWRI